MFSFKGSFNCAYCRFHAAALSTLVRDSVPQSFLSAPQMIATLLHMAGILASIGDSVLLSAHMPSQYLWLTHGSFAGIRWTATRT